MDSEDEAWLASQSKKIELTSNTFEEMIDRLEKGSGQQVINHHYSVFKLKSMYIINACDTVIVAVHCELLHITFLS